MIFLTLEGTYVEQICGLRYSPTFLGRDLYFLAIGTVTLTLTQDLHAMHLEQR